MNLFRFIGDMSHLASVVLLLFRIHTTKSCAGISLKTHELYALVFVTRYLDVLTTFISVYNTIMKFIYLVSAFLMIWYIRGHGTISKTYDKDFDTFRHHVLILCCLVLALATNEMLDVIEILWTFSQILEAVAILPQLALLQKTNNISNLTWQYVSLFGIYRPMYILNWIYKYFTDPFFMNWLYTMWKSYVSGVIQTIIYVIFCYYYIKSWKISKNFELNTGSESLLIKVESEEEGQDVSNLDNTQREHTQLSLPQSAISENQKIEV